MKKILVTGGSGFIGSHIVRHHLQKNDQVWAIDDLSTGNIDNLEFCKNNPNFRFSRADICNWQELQEAVKWSDCIYHMAAVVGQFLVLSDSARTLSSNIHGCQNVLEAIANTKSPTRLLIASTSSVYCHSEPDNGAFYENNPLTYPSGKFIQEVYPLSKLINEVMGLSYVAQKGLFCAIARIFNSIGPHQKANYGMVVPNFVKRALKNEPLLVYGDGQQRRAFTHVHDTVQGLNLLLESDKANGQIVNVGNNRDCSILDLANLVIKKTSSSSKITFVPYREAYGMDFVDVQLRVPSQEKLLQITNFRPKITLEEAIDDIIASEMVLKG